jgi:alginate O-acetyltransferase complex protein AlgJ
MLNKRSATRLCWLLLLTLTLVSTARIALDSYASSPVTLGDTPVSNGLEVVPAVLDQFRVKNEASYPMIAWAVTLEANQQYRACLPVIGATEATDIVVDIMGTAYDNATQEHLFKVAKSESPSNYCVTFDSELPPSNTSLRVMFAGVGGVVNAKVDFGLPRLEKLLWPTIGATLKTTQFALMILTCALAIGLAAIRRFPFSETQKSTSLGLRDLGKIFFCVAVFGLSIIPAILAFQSQPPDIAKVQELRVLASMPSHWTGRFLDIDKNFAAFERWFNDNLAYRSLMIRFKNQIDYSIFNTSNRVYFGKQGEIYGRPMLDKELPASEHLFSDPELVDRIGTGIERMADNLRAEGITLVLIAPPQRQHFSQTNLPYFAPRIAEPSNYLKLLLPRLQRADGVRFVDVYTLMSKLPKDLPRYYRQDFHWSDFSALAASNGILEVISGKTYPFTYPKEIHTTQEIGSETRFAALLTEKPVDERRIDMRNLPSIHKLKYLDSAQGYEYETDLVENQDLLPSTCGFGNSFMDGMIHVGFPNHFQKFTRLSRKLAIEEVPSKVFGRCEYLVMQILDIQFGHWANLAKE